MHDNSVFFFVLWSERDCSCSHGGVVEESGTDRPSGCFGSEVNAEVNVGELVGKHEILGWSLRTCSSPLQTPPK